MSKKPTTKLKGPSTAADKNRPESDTNTDRDEEFARQLQEQLLNEQEEMDAELARRLHEEEQSKLAPVPMMMQRANEGRPMSATPIQSLFQAMFNLRPQTLELDEEEGEDTPAMSPTLSTSPTAGATSATAGATGTSGPRLRTTPPRQAARRSPERPRRGIRLPERGLRGRGAGTTPARNSTETANPSVPGPRDNLPGVRPNPAHQRFRQPHNRRLFFVNRPAGPFQLEDQPEVDGENDQSNMRPLSALRRVPGLGPREDTMNLPDGELDPELMVLDDSPSGGVREDNFVNIMRDPFLLMLLLMGRDPGFMVPDNIDLGDYESLWELAERLGEVRNRGMKEDEINRIPTRTYRNKSDDKSKTESCSICLSEYKTGEKVQILPCQHEYHQQCMIEWLKRNASCPVCRQDVKRRPSV